MKYTYWKCFILSIHLLVFDVIGDFFCSAFVVFSVCSHVDGCGGKTQAKVLLPTRALICCEIFGLFPGSPWLTSVTQGEDLPLRDNWEENTRSRQQSLLES